MAAQTAAPPGGTPPHSTEPDGTRAFTVGWTNRPMPRRFYSLDVLRGLAALSVVLWHWQHFFAPLNPRGIALERERQPFYPALSFLYRHGFTAVELFFCLSGFIFFWLYGAPVARRSIPAGRFFRLRFSRLYPLHLLTLVIVAFGQHVFRSITQAYFVYPINDAYHFVLNLLFVSSWGFQKGYSFNAPVWSVSVEVFLYCVFFILCRFGRPGLPGIFLALVAGGLLLDAIHPLGLGLVFFFLGGLGYKAYEALVRCGRPARLGRLLPAITLLCWIGAVWVVTPERQIAVPLPLRRFGDDVFSLLIYPLFPLTVLSLALLETARGSLGRRFAFVGDMSYSSYLLHFPLQLAFAGGAAALSIPAEIFYSRGLFLSFFALLCLAALASHCWFEMPMQRRLRSERATCAP